MVHHRNRNIIEVSGHCTGICSRFVRR